MKSSKFTEAYFVLSPELDNNLMAMSFETYLPKCKATRSKYANLYNVPSLFNFSIGGVIFFLYKGTIYSASIENFGDESSWSQIYSEQSTALTR